MDRVTALSELSKHELVCVLSHLPFNTHTAAASQCFNLVRLKQVNKNDRKAETVTLRLHSH